MAGEAQRVVFDCVVCAQAIINPDKRPEAVAFAQRFPGIRILTPDALLKQIQSR